MKMTKKLADELLDCLACRCISANGGVPKDGLTKEQLEVASAYARATFIKLTNEWEDTIGEKWVVL